MNASPILSSSLCKAARSLLDWQQHDLAQAAGLSLTAVNNFERGASHTREKTLLVIRNTLEENGIEFISGGVRKVDEAASITRFSGKNFIHQLNDDIFATIHKPHTEFMTCSTDDHLWPKYGGESHEEWKRFVKRMDVRERIIVPETNTRFNAPRQIYRLLPPALIGKISYGIYVDKVAYILWRKMQVFTIRNRDVADALREQFKYLWRLGRPA